ncbi:hypothetical protein PRIC2_008847 [Phytophthora ramorum]
MEMAVNGCYIDTLGLEAYNSHTGQEFTVSELVTGSPPEVFDAWIREVWLAGGEQLHEGTGREYIGSVRRVPLGVEEEILSAGQPDEDVVAEDKDGEPRIPSICYRVLKSGPFPLASHLAMVSFINAESISEEGAGTASTLVVWTVKTEMSSTCKWLHCGGLVRLVFRTALKSFLRSLAKKTASALAL